MDQSHRRCILILYTTLYRRGGAEFARAATQLRKEKRREFPQLDVICQPVQWKLEFRREIEKIETRGAQIQELHFIGHSGLYGIMFGTADWPEQFSPYEWRHLRIPFAPGAKAYFHACRTGRWFAPYFARTFHVKTYGYFWYTTVSADKNRFVWEGFRKLLRGARASEPVYIVSVPGKKSHGLLGSLRKYVSVPAAYPFLEFEPSYEKIDPTYDSVAELYDETFADISVRADELKWLRAQLKETPQPKALLDIGCGTGSFLRGIADLTESAHGVDLSPKMIEQARRRSPGGNLVFTQISGPQLPFPDHSFDVVTSVLSFRYLDWDPIVAEILRVLKPGGRLLVIDMVAAPAGIAKLPRLMVDKTRQQLTLMRHPRYHAALRRMVTDAGWKKMLAFNPMRAEHELKWYLQSRFPSSRLSVINYAWNSRIVAFNSAPVFKTQVERQSFP